MSAEPIVFRPRVAPDPEAQRRLDERLALIVAPATVVLHRDRVQPRLRRSAVAESLPALLRRQAG